jgi:uncharacterized membrane protein YdjX (TVP38/TMEM64 family)
MAKRVGLVVGLLVLALIAWMAWNHGLITRWKESASPLPFFTGMAIVPAIGFPITPLFVLAGATFGRRVGLIGSFAALAVNLALCYFIARTGLRRWLARLVRRFDYELPDFAVEARGAWRFLLMVKMAPGIPQAVKNYALGVAAVPFWLYFGASMLFGGAYAVALNVLGESLFRHQGVRSILLVAAVVVAALGVWWWRKRGRGSATDE